MRPQPPDSKLRPESPNAWWQQGWSYGYREGLAKGYRIAVDASYPEIWTMCSAHALGDFDSTCTLCTAFGDD